MHRSVGKYHLNEKIFGRLSPYDESEIKIMKRSKRVFSVMIAVVMTFACTVSLASASVYSDLQQGRRQEKDLNQQVRSLQSRIATLSNEIAEKKTDIAKAESDIRKLQLQVKKNKASLNKGEKDLGSRLRSMYKSGSVGFVDVVLESGDVTELLNNIEMVKRIYSYDQKVVSKLEKNYKAVKGRQNKIKETKAKLSKENASLEKKQKELKESETALNSKLKKVMADNEALETRLYAAAYTGGSYVGGGSGGNGGSGGSGGGTPSYNGGGMIWPVGGPVTSGFGPRWGRLHEGIDIGTSYGHPIVAAKAGTVTTAGWYHGLGLCVIIDHGGGLVTRYGHNSSLCVRPGQHVGQGQVIAKAGSTGNSTGVHCHFGVWVNGRCVNPMNYL